LDELLVTSNLLKKINRYLETFTTNLPAGNICGIIGVDNYIFKEGTIIASGDTISQPLNLKDVKTLPVIRGTLSPVNASDLPKLHEKIKIMARYSQVIVSPLETGEFAIDGPSMEIVGNVTRVLLVIFLRILYTRCREHWN
jgi:hypothetical protein